MDAAAVDRKTERRRCSKEDWRGKSRVWPFDLQRGC